jgi:hypothetical protein
MGVDVYQTPQFLSAVKKRQVLSHESQATGALPSISADLASMSARPPHWHTGSVVVVLHFQPPAVVRMSWSHEMDLVKSCFLQDKIPSTFSTLSD